MQWDEHIGKVICGDAIETMKGIPDSVVQCCVTSPPYWGLRDYGLEPIVWGGDNGCRHEWGDTLPAHHPGQVPDGKAVHDENAVGQNIGSGHFCSLCSAWRGNLGLEPNPEIYVEHLVEVFREVRRILRDDGTLWLNLGDSYNTSPAGNLDGQHNTGCVNYDRDRSTRGKTQKLVKSLKPKDLCMIPARVALALQADGWWLRSVIIWHKPSCMPESVTNRPTTAHEYVYLLAKSESYYYDAGAIREPQADSSNERYRYDFTGRAATIYPQKSGSNLAGERELNPAGRNKRTVWTINPEPTPYAHFATFPQKLVEPCIMAGTSEKGNCGKCGKPWVRVVEKTRGKTLADWQTSCDCVVNPVPPIVLDPFSGSGTVGVVAKKLQRKYVLIDLNAEYNKIAIDRLRQCEMELT